MKRINIKVLFVWLFCVLIVAATTASVFVTKSSRASPLSFDVVSTPVSIARGTLVGNQLQTILQLDTFTSDALANGQLGPLSTTNIGIYGRLARFSE